MQDVINVHGFDSFLKENGTSDTDSNLIFNDISRIPTSWSNYSVLTDDGLIQMQGHKGSIYQKMITEFVGQVKDIAYLDNSFVVLNNLGKVFVVLDKHRHDQCYNVTFDKELQHIIQLNSTEKDLIILLESNECLRCENLTSNIQSDDENEKPMLQVQLPLFIISHSIATVSCGKEHVLLLTTYGTVMTFGSNSRGQLGNGTVDTIKEPQIVDCLAGLKMITVAAGGWHSLCLSDCGDAYCWGWNESGQLGIPSNSVRDKPGSKESSDTKYHQHSENTQNLQGQSPVISKTDIGCHIKHSKSNTMTLIQEKQDNTVEDGNTLLKDIDMQESMLFLQDTDPVQVQPFPYLIDLQDKFNIKKASCGSRHTALLTEDGVLLTAGWNDYGQLCQDDVISRDFFETVPTFIKSKTKIKNVYCGPWNTFIIT